MESPKVRFCRSTHAKQFNDLIQMPIMEEALDVAMLQFINDLGSASSFDAGTSVENAMAMNFKREGAIKFLSTLLNIGKTNIPILKEEVGVLRERRPTIS